jgi:hypothetical protein
LLTIHPATEAPPQGGASSPRKPLARVIASLCGLFLCAFCALFVLQISSTPPASADEVSLRRAHARLLSAMPMTMQHSFNDCGLASVMNFARLLHRNVSDAARADLNPDIAGIDVAHVRAALTKIGIATRARRHVGLPDESRYPAIVLIRHHYVVLRDRLNGDEIDVLDPWLGHVALSRSAASHETVIVLEPI